MKLRMTFTNLRLAKLNMPCKTRHFQDRDSKLGVNSPRLLVFEKTKSPPKKISLWPKTMPKVLQKSPENHAKTLPNRCKSRPAAAEGRRRPTFGCIWKSFGMVCITFLRDFWHGFWPEAEFFWGCLLYTSDAADERIV